MKHLSLVLFLSLISLSSFAAGSSLEKVKDVDLVREVLRRGLSVDAVKIGKLTTSCQGSSLILTVTNESDAVSHQEMVHMNSGQRECEANLEVLGSKLGDFYDAVSLNVCVGSTLRTYVIESNLNIVKMSSKYVGVNQCLLLARELNKHQD